MEFTTQWRLLGDHFCGHYANGLTMSNGESVRGMKKLSEDDGCTVFEGKRGHKIKCLHEFKNGVYTCRSVFENTTDETARLELLSSFAINGIKADKIHRATSFWSAEGKLLSQTLTELNMEPSWSHNGIRVEKFGQLGSMPVRKWFPFLVLEDSEKGEFLGVQLYCASSWQIEVMVKTDTVYIQGGLADRDFGSWFKDIKAGESFETPKAVVATGSSIYEVCDKLVKAQNPRISKHDRDLPVIFNEYCTTWGNPTIENIKKTAERLEGSGVKYLVIDSGWYKTEECRDWYSGTGHWIPSKELFPNGIKEVADIIKSHGLIPGLWYEFECLGDKSEGYYMTDHLLTRDGYPVTTQGRRFWDMRDKWVWSFLDERVINLLRDAGFGYIKVDYNDTIGLGVDGAESIGEGLRQTVEKSREYFLHMGDEIEDLVIENCSSGGHRLEPSFMETSSMASFSDAHECNCIPIIAANMHRVIRPEQSQIWAVLRADASTERINYLLTASFLGRLCLSGEIFDLSEKHWNLALDSVKFYSKIKHIIKDGFTELIECTAKDYSKPEGYQVVLRTLKDEALLIVHTFENASAPDLTDILSEYEIKDSFGSELNGEFRGRAYLLQRR
ncbi:MAG: alpha-galactosidase [Eubacterium sp.]|nr:alpha-galactosidase [Eubacterium sp.]